MGAIMGHQSMYEPYDLELGGKKIADIVITHHARMRWTDRVEQERTGFSDICAYLWGTLKDGNIKPYYKNEQEVYLVDEDLVMVAEFTQLTHQLDYSGKPLYKLIVVTFLGRMSEMIELRDLKSYYSWLRHSRRMTLIKNGRKRK